MIVAKTATEAVRIDKWLWAARFFKTRTLAASAVTGGKVRLNGARVKAAKGVHVNDSLHLSIGPFEYTLRVLALSERRGPATEAARLYEESAESQAARQALASRLAAERPLAVRQAGRPSKKQRRQILRFKKSGGG